MMKIYKNCPVCEKESKIGIKQKISINSGVNITDIENDEIFQNHHQTFHSTEIFVLVEFKNLSKKFMFLLTR